MKNISNNLDRWIIRSTVDKSDQGENDKAAIWFMMIADGFL